MRTVISSLVALAAPLLLLGPAAAQSTPDPDIVVEAPRPSDEELVRAYVGALTVPSQQAALPRWTDRICSGIVGLQPQFARAMNDRLARVAQRFEVRTGLPGCNPNVIIMFTDHPEEAAVMLTNRPGEDLDNALEALTPDPNSPLRAVRWWHVSGTEADGFAVSTDTTIAEQEGEAEAPETPGGVGQGITANHAVRVRDATRLRSTTEQVLMKAVIVIDTRQIEGIPVRALADFITMVTLAQINQNADVRDAPTILNLFSRHTDAPPQGMTAWDYAYLEALYSSRSDARDARQHENLLIRHMTRAQ